MRVERLPLARFPSPQLPFPRNSLSLCCLSASVNSANNRSVFRLSGDTRRADPDRIHRSRKTLVEPYLPYRIAEKQQHATDTRCGFWKDAARWHRCSCGTDTESFSGRAGVH